MLAKITLQSESVAGKGLTTFTPTSCNIVVGPNNAGKSLFLREFNSVFDQSDQRERKIILNIEPQRLTESQIRTLLSERPNYPIFDQRSRPGWRTTPRVKFNSGSGMSEGMEFHLDDTPRLIAADAKRHFQIVRLHTLVLDGNTRLSLLNSVEMRTLVELPREPLVALFRDDAARGRLRAICFEAFGRYLVFDASTSPGHVSVRFAKDAPNDGIEKQLTLEAVSYHHDALGTHEVSDGVLAYAGSVAALLSSDFRIFLIDEPEAFLHPPLARRLGGLLAELADERSGQVFISTHSPEVLMGAIQTNVPVTIIRLTYQNGVATSRTLESARVAETMRDPLLRSAGALSALFHEGVVVCEGQVDRVFYQEINARLVGSKSGGIDSALFLNAMDKSTVRRLVAPLRDLGIPTAAIVDLDVLKKGDLGALCRDAGVPEPTVQAFETARRLILDGFGKLDPKDVGVDGVSGDTRKALDVLIADLARFGIFVVPVGEVERWLKALAVPGRRGQWLIEMLKHILSESVGVDVGAKSDIDNAWNFVRDVVKWIRNPQRLGMSN